METDKALLDRARKTAEALRCCGVYVFDKNCGECPACAEEPFPCPKMMPKSAAVIDALIARFVTVTAERDAVAADMKLIADAYRTAVCDDGICGLCDFDADHGENRRANECPGFKRDDCFQWRGQHGAGEGGK